MGVVGSDDPNYLWKGLFLGFVLLVFTIYQWCLAHNYFKYCTLMAMNGRSAVVAAIYRKVSVDWYYVTSITSFWRNNDAIITSYVRWVS